MKVILLFLALAIPTLGKAQAHLYLTPEEIKEMFPQKVFKTDYANDGTKYITTDIGYGTFVYYFDKETGKSYRCVQIPENMTALNTQVEIYNKKYVIISKTKWTAYLEGGGRMSISLGYDEQYKMYRFVYEDAE